MSVNKINRAVDRAMGRSAAGQLTLPRANRSSGNESAYINVKAYSASDNVVIPTEYSYANEVLTSLPRAEMETSATSDYTLEVEDKHLKFRPKKARALRTVFTWFEIGLRYQLGNFMDNIMFRSSERRQAVRMRKVFEKKGGSIQKLGQTLSMRIDILTWTECVELSRMSEDVKPIPMSVAIQSIEKASKQSFTDLFLRFDPDPIMSETMSCTYKAILKRNNMNVHIRVRRPEAAENILADLKSLGWYIRTLEFLTFVHQGFTDKFMHEMEISTLEELNFIKESRHQELFRCRIKKKLKQKNHFTAPQVFFDISDNDVIIEEQLPGIGLKEIYTALEGNNTAAIQQLRHFKIDLEKLGERLLQASFVGMMEDIFFIADPDPDSILVMPKSRLAFTEFSSCGSLIKAKSSALQQFSYYERQDNIQGMVQAAMSLLEPLPPVDVDALKDHLEKEFKEAVYQMKNKSGGWEQRTTAKIWMAFMRIVREQEIMMDSDTIRLIRSCMLYDNLATRLSSKIKYFKELDKFITKAGGRAKKRILKKGKNMFTKKSDNRNFLMAEMGLDLTNQVIFKMQRMLNIPSMNFGSVIGKWSTVILAMQKVVSDTVTFSIMFMSGILFMRFFEYIRAGGDIKNFTFHILEIGTSMVESTWFHAGVTIFVLLGLRRIQTRLRDHDED